MSNYSLDAELENLKSTLIEWRHDLHAHPEIAFEEHRTSAFVAEKLREFGLEVTTGVARTGVIGTLRRGEGENSYAFRADMDALLIEETNEFEHRSRYQGKMHACGHDGHTAMLLGAAKILAQTENLNGTLHFIFQPAEENEGGARLMLEEKLLERFPIQSIFGMHNFPGLPLGEFAINKGHYMASCNSFELEVLGKGCHAAMPEQGVDPIVIGTQIVQAYQHLLSRMKPAQAPAILSVTQFHAGDALNVCPETATIKGSCRSFDPEMDDWMRRQLENIAAKLCSAYGADYRFDFSQQYPVLTNHDAQTDLAATVAKGLVGEDSVNTEFPPVMGSEDFAFFLQQCLGSYIFIGNGTSPVKGATACMLHNPGYDFNDEALTLGVKYWVSLAETLLKQ